MAPPAAVLLLPMLQLLLLRRSFCWSPPPPPPPAWGGPAAAVVFAREVRARVAADERVRKIQRESGESGKTQSRAALDKVRHEVTLEKQAELAEEFDRIHSVQRAQAVGSLGNIIPPDTLRPFLIGQLRQSAGLEEEG